MNKSTTPLEIAFENLLPGPDSTYRFKDGTCETLTVALETLPRERDEAYRLLTELIGLAATLRTRGSPGLADVIGSSIRNSQRALLLLGALKGGRGEATLLSFEAFRGAVEEKRAPVFGSRQPSGAVNVAALINRNPSWARQSAAMKGRTKSLRPPSQIE